MPFRVLFLLQFWDVARLNLSRQSDGLLIVKEAMVEKNGLGVFVAGFLAIWVGGLLIVKALPWLETVLLFGVVAGLGIVGLMWKAFVVVVYVTVAMFMFQTRPARFRSGGRR